MQSTLKSLFTSDGKFNIFKTTFIVALAAAIIAGTAMFMFSSREQDVKLVVDGKPMTQKTASSKVGEVLNDAGIASKGADVSVPLDSEVSENQKITVKTPKEVSVKIDGKAKTVDTTAVTVGDLSEELGAKKNAKIIPKKDTKIANLKDSQGAQITITNPKKVKLNNAGKKKELRSTGETVGDVLQENKITLGNQDTVSKDKKAPVTNGMEVKISRVGTQTEKVFVEVPYDTEELADSNKVVGERVVYQAGHAGYTNANYEVSYVNGEEVSRVYTGDEVLQVPTKEIVLVGSAPKTQEETARATAPASADSASEAPNEAADSAKTQETATVPPAEPTTEASVETQETATVPPTAQDVQTSAPDATASADSGSYVETETTEQASPAPVQDTTQGSVTAPEVPEATQEASPPAASAPPAVEQAPASDGLNWAALAQCESGGNPSVVSPYGYEGLYQFDVQTWHSVGGTGTPSQASAEEQTKRAQILYSQRGTSPWPQCGRLL